MKTAISTTLLFVLFWFGPLTGRAQEKPRQGEPAFAMLERLARECVKTGEWRNANWTDPGFDRAFDIAIREVAGIMKGQPEKLVLPVTLASGLKASRANDALDGKVSKLQREFFLADNATVAFAHDSIIIADGNVRISHAQQCVIFSRGVTNISHSYGNVVISGHFIQSSHDGAHGQDDPRVGRNQAARSSFLFSGGAIAISHSKDTICHAPKMVQISHANGTVLVNSPSVRTSHEKNCSRVTSDKLKIFPPYSNPLADKNIVVLKGITRNDAGKPGEATLNVGKRQYVVTEGQEVGQAEGAPVAAMAGWKLSYVGPQYALFTKGKADAGFWIAGR